MIFNKIRYLKNSTNSAEQEIEEHMLLDEVHCVEQSIEEQMLPGKVIASTQLDGKVTILLDLVSSALEGSAEHFINDEGNEESVIIARQSDGNITILSDVIIKNDLIPSELKLQAQQLLINEAQRTVECEGNQPKKNRTLTFC